MAGLGRRTFAPGEVLTASNVMNYLQDQVVQTYAGTAARGSAIGTAVSEGMVSYLADSNEIEVYDGSAWSPLAFESYVDAKPASGMVPIVAPTINISGGTATSNTAGLVSFSAVSSISLNDIFSSDYDSYKVIFRTTNAGANGLSVRLRLRAGGTDNSSSVYSFAIPLVNNSGSFTSQTNSVTSNFDIGGAATNFSSLSELIFSKPNISTSWTSVNWSIFWHSGGSFFGGSGGGYHAANYQATGFTFYPSSSNITGTVQVFGFKND